MLLDIIFDFESFITLRTFVYFLICTMFSDHVSLQVRFWWTCLRTFWTCIFFTAWVNHFMGSQLVVTICFKVTSFAWVGHIREMHFLVVFLISGISWCFVLNIALKKFSIWMNDLVTCQSTLALKPLIAFIAKKSIFRKMRSTVVGQSKFLSEWFWAD